MILYQYLCTNCDTENHIHWEIIEDYQVPYCCECGHQINKEQYEFIKKLEVNENDN